MSSRLFSAADEAGDSGKAWKRAEADERAPPGKERPAEGWLEEHIGTEIGAEFWQRSGNRGGWLDVAMGEIFPEAGNDSRGKSFAEVRGLEQSRGGPMQ